MYIHLCVLQVHTLSLASGKRTFYLFAMCTAYHIGNEHGVRFVKALSQLKMKTNTH